MRLIYSFLIIITAISCSESKSLQKSLTKYKVPIGYLQDSKKLLCAKSDSLVINLNNTTLDSTTSVSRINGLVLPFIIFNHVSTNMKVKLGQNSIQENYNDFFTNSFITESSRSGCFGIATKKTNDSIYTLDLKIDTCITSSKYSRSTTVIFLLVAYSMSFSEWGSPAETYLHVSASLKKGEKIIYEKKYIVKRNQPFVNSRIANTNKLRSDFTVNMVESLSLSTKQCVEDIITDINSSIKQ